MSGGSTTACPGEVAAISEYAEHGTERKGVKARHLNHGDASRGRGCRQRLQQIQSTHPANTESTHPANTTPSEYTVHTREALSPASGESTAITVP